MIYQLVKKQDLVMSYIDLIEVIKNGKDLEVTNINYRPTFIEEYINLFNNGGINKIEEIRKENYDGIFIPELCLVRGNKNDDLYRKIIDRNYFKSIDLVGDETLGVNDFIDIYSYAKSNNMILRCHVGEFSTANYINDALIKLNLDEIQHGLSIINDMKLMNKIKEQGIRVNLCPASNIGLGTVKEYSYPLRILLDNGIKVSINTDDLLIFNKTISDIYLDLYNTQKFSIEELNKIRVDNL